MVKASLKFDLNEDVTAFNLAVNGHKAFSKLYEIDQNCRSWIKHGHNFNSSEEVLEKIKTIDPIIYELYIH